MISGRSIDHVVVAVGDLARAGETYESLGFRLTPTAHHEDRMGTSNRLAQFKEKNFIELLEVDRPDALAPHDFSQAPPFFSFGAHNKAAAAKRDGLSMLVFYSDDARADISSFRAVGIATYAPFDFERQARLPDGAEATLAFTLAFATSPEMPDIGFFACQNRAPDLFWKAGYQSHDNGAGGIRIVYLCSPSPHRDAAFIGKMFAAAITEIAGGWRVACGSRQEVRVLEPEAIAKLDPSQSGREATASRLAGIALSCEDARETIPSTDACGLFIEWVKT